MGMIQYCWSTVAQISVTMTRWLNIEDRRERRQLTVCSVGRRANSSNRRWYAAEKNNNEFMTKVLTSTGHMTWLDGDQGQTCPIDIGEILL